MNNFKSIIDSFEDFSNQHPVIETFTFGNLSDTGQDEEPLKYPLMHVIPVTSTLTDQYADFNFQIIFGEMLDDVKTNQVNCVEECYMILQDFIEYYTNQLTTSTYHITTPISFTPFLDKLSVYIAGVEASVTFRAEGTYCL
jgi:hypothetical protein